MKAIAIIPARYASTRFPGKPLIDIGGKTMIQRVYEQASKAGLISEVWVATDDERIYTEVERFGGRAIMTSSDCQNGTDRCAEAMNKLDKPEIEIVLNLQGDEPFAEPGDMDKLISCFAKHEVQISTLCREFKDHKEFDNSARVKVLVNQQDLAQKFTRNRDGVFTYGQPQVYLHLGVYAFRTETLRQIVLLPPTVNEEREQLEQLRWLDHGYRMQCALTSHHSIAVDYPEDLEKIKGLY